MLPKLLLEQLLARKGWRLTDHTKGLYGCKWWVDECEVQGFGTTPEAAVADALAQEPILVQRHNIGQATLGAYR